VSPQRIPEKAPRDGVIPLNLRNLYPLKRKFSDKRENKGIFRPEVSKNLPKFRKRKPQHFNQIGRIPRKLIPPFIPPNPNWNQILNRKKPEKRYWKSQRIINQKLENQDLSKTRKLRTKFQL